MADIIIVRHGNTDWNQKERFRGHANIGLNETGREQAVAVAKRLAKVPVSFIYTSPLSRAVETAEIIAEPHHLNLNLLHELIDIDYGDLEGLSLDEAERNYSDIYYKWLRSPHEIKFPGGESLEEVRLRASAALDKIISQMSAETVVFVSHKIVISVLILHFLNLDNSQLRQIGQDTCAINIFTKQNTHFYANLLNDTCHLAGIS